MKRFFAIFLTLSLAAALTACGPKVPQTPAATDPVSTQPQTTEDVAPSTTPSVQHTPSPEAATELSTEAATQPDAAFPSVAVCNRRVVETTQQQTWRYGFTLTYDDITVCTGDSLAEARIEESLARDQAEIRTMADQTLADLAQYQQDLGELPSASSLQQSLIPTRVDSRIVSFSGRLDYYTAGAIHPNVVLKALTFDTVTGARLTLKDLIPSDDSLAVLEQKVLDRLEEMGPDGFYPEYENIVAFHFNPASESSQDWYLTGQGMVCFFSPYDIAPYAAGSITILIPYSELDEILAPAYLPPETAATNGFLSAALAGNRTPDFQATLDANGEKIDLTVGGTVTQVLVETVESQDGVSYTLTGALFAADQLNDGQVLRLSAFLPDAMSNLRLTYTGTGGTVTRYISQSGKDGSILLLDES